MMRKLFGCFSLIIFLSVTSFGQLVFDFSSSSTVTQGGTIDIDVSVSDFDDLVGVQVFLFWDPTVMSFNGISDLTTDLPEFTSSSISTPEDTEQGQDGIVGISWFKTTPESLPDNTKLFTISFDTDGVQCAETSLQVGDNPFNQFAVIEVSNSSFENIGAEASPFDVVIPGTDCGSGGGGDDGVGINIGTLTGDAGSNVCVPVTVENFTDIQTIQGSINWDPSVLSFTGVQNLGLPGFTPDGGFNTGNVASGNLGFVWFDNTGSNPVTLPDGTVIFEVCFDVIGSSGSSSSIDFTDNPTSIEIGDSSGTALDFFTNSGSITVSGEGGGGDDGIGFIVADAESQMGDMICIPVTTIGFTDVQSIQGGMMWDPMVLEYTGVENLNLPGWTDSSFNADSSDDGMLSYIWFDNTGSTPASLPDGSIVYDICFNVLGDIGTTTEIKFINSPDIEFSDSNGDVIEPINMQSGTFTVIDDAMVLPFGLTSPDVTGEMGETVCIDITAQNFVNIASIQLSMQWQGSLTYIGLENLLEDAGFVMGAFSLTANNELSLSWFSPGATDQTFPDGTVLFSICFELGECETTGTLDFVNGTVTDIEIGNSAGDVLEFDFSTINVAVGDCAPPPVLSISESIDNVDCFNQSGGSITLDITGGSGDYTCEWRFGEPNGPIIGSTDCSIFNQTAGTYYVTIEDQGNPGGVVTQEYEITQPDQITSDPNILPVGCSSAGEISIVASGGVPGYSYNWSNGGTTSTISGLEAATYSVTIIDAAQCQIVYQYVVADNGSGFSINPIVFDATTCNGGGSIEVNDENITGGTPPYSFSWDNGLPPVCCHFNLSPGMYNATITDSQDCMSTISRTISNLSPMLTINPTVFDATTCDGGSIEINDNNVSGGTAPFSFSWDSGLPPECCHFNLEPGMYNATVTDSQGCTSTISRSINNLNPPLTITILEQIDPCNGEEDGIFEFDITGGCPTYDCMAFSPDGVSLPCDGLTGLGSGDYTISITDGYGQQFDGSFSLEESSLITITEDSIAIGAAFVTIEGGTPEYTYNWSNGVEVISTDEDLVGVPEGTYTLTVIDSNGCMVSSEPIGVPGPGMINIVGLEITTDFNGFSVSCNNICDGNIDASVSSNAALPLTIELFHSDGTIITATSFPVVNLCVGEYTLTVTDAGGISATESISLTAPDPIIIQSNSTVCSDGDNGSISLTVSGGAGGLQFSWDPDVGNESEVENLAPGGYLFFSTDQNGCEADALFTIEDCDDGGNAGPGEVCYDGSPFLTPNNDGANDFLIIACAETNDNQISVFDRWGRLVHQNTDYQNDWAGLDLDNQLLNEGTYYWVMNVAFDNGDSRIYKGYVTLLRDE